MRPSPAFITTPIFYANAKSHIGHAYTLCMSDAWSRYTAIRHHPSLQAFPPKRVALRPLPTSASFLSTGVDEHGTKIAQTAAAAGKTPQELCDEVSGHFLDLCKVLNINTGAFIRTTSDVHKQTVRRVWKLLDEAGYLYWSSFSGWYSAVDEAFYGDWEVEEEPPTVGESTAVAMRAKSSGNRVEWVVEDTCRFSLSAFKPRLHEWLDSGVFPKHSQEHARLLAQTHESLDKLDDPSVSRPSSRVSWGIPVPGRDDQTIYVWFDALINYLTAGHVTFDPECHEPTLWPPSVQFIGKDIVRFHAILWPAMLMALNAPLPRKLIPHGHILVSGTKMSKSLGNVLSPADVIEHFASLFSAAPSSNPDAVARDCLRYILIRSATFNEDTTFSLPLAQQIVNTELVNCLGNLLSRVTSKRIVPTQTAPTFDLGEAQQFLSRSQVDAEMFQSLTQLPGLFDSHWNDQLLPNRSIDALVAVVRQTNAFVDRHKPWHGGDSSAAVVGISLEVLRLIGCLLWPTAPSIADDLLARLGVPGNKERYRNSQWTLCSSALTLVPRLK